MTRGEISITTIEGGSDWKTIPLFKVARGLYRVTARHVTRGDNTRAAAVSLRYVGGKWEIAFLPDEHCAALYALSSGGDGLLKRLSGISPYEELTPAERRRDWLNYCVELAALWREQAQEVEEQEVEAWGARAV